MEEKDRDEVAPQSCGAAEGCHIEERASGKGLTVRALALRSKSPGNTGGTPRPSSPVQTRDIGNT